MPARAELDTKVKFTYPEILTCVPNGEGGRTTYKLIKKIYNMHRVANLTLTKHALSHGGYRTR
jgi:hypothetical protein